MPPNDGSGHLMLSISTIASAIADASISTDPLELAAMILKMGRTRNQPESSGPVLNCSDKPHLSEQVRPVSVQDAVLLLQ